MAAPVDCNDRYILMKDTPGEKSASSSIVSVIKKPFVGGNSSRQIMVLRGELLGQIPPSQQQPRSDGLAHNYFVDKDPSTTLFVVDEQGISPLSLEEYQLLRAIDSCYDRFTVFVNGDWLEWGVKLNVGDQVYVRLPAPNPTTADWSLGFVRCKGNVHSLPGTNFGVEIYDAQHCGKGSSDGYFQSYQYFRCEHNCGMFVSLEKICFNRRPRGIQGDLQNQRQYVPTTTSDNRESYASALSKLLPTTAGTDVSTPDSDVDPPSSKAPSLYKVNDRVVIFDMSDIALHGTVKWTGRKNRLGRVIHVGIEMNTRVNPAEVPGARAGIIDWFSAKKNHTIVIPESLVVTRAAYVASDKKKPQHLVAKQNPPFSVDDPVAMARDLGMTKQQFMAEQHKILKEAEKQKKKQDKEIASQNKDAEEIKLALGESINIAAQKQLLADIRKRGNEEGSGSQGQQPYLHPDQSSLDKSGIKQQHSWQPGADRIYEVIPGDRDRADTHRRLGLQGKSLSVAEGDRIGQFYQEDQQHQHRRGDNRHLARIPGPPGSSSPQQQQQHQQHYHQGQIREEHEKIHNQMAHQQYGQDGGYGEGDRQQGIALHQQQGIQGIGGVSPHQQHNVDKLSHHDYVNLDVLPMEPHSQCRSQPDRAPVEQQPNIQQWQSNQQQQPHQPPAQPGVIASTVPPGTSVMPNPNLGIGSRIQIPTNTPNDPFKYGVIRWICEVPQIQGPVAGIELEEPMEGCSDGTFNGVRYFSCRMKHSFFCPVTSLSLDQRFAQAVAIYVNPLDGVAMEEPCDRFINPGQIFGYIGEGKGIQGHQNSCYLDSTVFGLFAVSDVFDNMFLEQKAHDPAGDQVKYLLWKGIVNPLRKNGVVRYESIMKFKNKLEELGPKKGVYQNKRDPEEFLNLLFKHILHIPPLISIKRPSGVETEYFVRLLVEYHDISLPTVGDMIERMFREQKLQFTKVPSKLLVQITHKEYESRERIIPGLKLKLKSLLRSKYQCFMCGDSAWKECHECTRVFTTVPTAVHFCEKCALVTHTQTSGRAGHNVTDVATDPDSINELDLLSVICLKANHYVCFTRSDDMWIFFDSMANRVNDRYYIPKVVHVTDAINEWVYPANGDHTRLLNTPPRELPEYVRHFTQDIYLCVYIQPDVGMYGDFELEEEEIPKVVTYDMVQKEEHTELSRERVQQIEKMSQQIKELEANYNALQEKQKVSESQVVQLQEDLEREQHQQKELQWDLQKEKESSSKLQQQLSEIKAENRSLQNSQLESVAFGIEPWKVSRNKVEIGSVIGGGGWGVVNKGKLQVAVKQFYPNILSKQNISRLKREMQMLALIRHPNLLQFIAAVFDENEDHEQNPPYIITELLDMSLRAAYEKALLPSDSVLSVFQDVAQALDYLHRRHDPIIHRDVSSANVLLKLQEKGKVIAKLSDLGSANLAKEAYTMNEGARVYCAPEAFTSETNARSVANLTPKVDVYSYGIVLCEVATSKFPEGAQLSSMLTRVRREWPQLHQLIVACTNRHPEQRPTMANVLGSLKAFPPQN